MKINREICLKVNCQWRRTVGETMLCALHKWSKDKPGRGHKAKWSDAGIVPRWCRYPAEMAVTQ